MNVVYEGVYTLDEKIATRNLKPGIKVYGEKLFRQEETELRLWNPNRSKLSAGILKGLENLPIKPGRKVLYLGAASGTTASHVSDIVGVDGGVFCVESSAAPMDKLLNLCRVRENMIPLFYDANKPWNYAPFLEKVDVIYQDIAQKNQAEILLKNSSIYLKEEGQVMFAVKARAIDSAKNAESVISNEIVKIKAHFKVKEVLNLDPYEKDHAMVVAEKVG